MSIKLIVGIVGGLLALAGFLPYLRDIRRGTTKPHMFTWLIWRITQTVATGSMLQKGANFGAITFVVGTVFVWGIFFYTLTAKKENIKKYDWIALSMAIVSIVVWLGMKNPVGAIILASSIDGIGYIPTIRQSYQAPENETLSTWTTFIVADLCCIIALQEYNWGTLTYVSTLTVGNTIIASILYLRRK